MCDHGHVTKPFQASFLLCELGIITVPTSSGRGSGYVGQCSARTLQASDSCSVDLTLLMPLQARLFFPSCLYSKRIFCASLTIFLSVCLFYSMAGKCWFCPFLLCGSSCWVCGESGQFLAVDHVGPGCLPSQVPCAACSPLFIPSNRILKHVPAIT